MHNLLRNIHLTYNMCERVNRASAQNHAFPFIVIGGGGGQTPKCTDRKKNHVHETYNYARASEVSERLRNFIIYFNVSKYICINIQSMQFPFITYRIYGAINDNIPTRP